MIRPRSGDPAPADVECSSYLNSTDHGSQVPTSDRDVLLGELALAIAQEADLRASVRHETQTGAVVLHVVNPQATDRSEDIGCELLYGEWWFVWRSHDTIGTVDDLEGVAKVIVHELTV